MANNIGAGDTVVVIRPTFCCDNSVDIGHLFKVVEVMRWKEMYCSSCLGIHAKTIAVERIEGDWVYGIDVRRLIKIDPPATGDSLPTRKELEQQK